MLLIVGIKLILSYHYYAHLTYKNQKLIAFIESFHPYDDLVFIVIQIFQVLVAGALPAEVSGVIDGYLYCSVVGTICSTIGLSIGSWLAFLLPRVFGMPLVRRLVNPMTLDKYYHFVEARGSLVCFILFLIPGFPKAARCYIIGLSQMNIRKFIAVRPLAGYLVPLCFP